MDIGTIEDTFLQGDFQTAMGMCRPSVRENCELENAVKTGIEIDAHSKQEVLLKHRVAAIFIQCLYERGIDKSSPDLQLAERYLKQNGPLPFELVVMWINLKTHLGQHEYCKELLEILLGKLAERVKGSGVATTEMCHQYSELARIYTVQTLTALGEIENAQRFLAIHSKNVLLPREKRQILLHELNEEIACHEKEILNNIATNGEDGESQNSGSSPPETPQGSQQRRASGSASTPSPTNRTVSSTAENGQQGGADAPNSSRKKKTKKPEDNTAIVITKDQATYLGAGLVAAVVLISQRKRISNGLTILGNALFSGT